eukprot:Nk52_evm19s367 gene=Nk52_evmTU19s367
MGLFGKSKTPAEKLKEWRLKIKKEERVLDRQIRGIETEQGKVKQQIKQAAKRGDQDVCRVLARELVASKKTVNKLHASKAQLNSIMMEMQHQVATVKMAGCMEKSSNVMKSMNRLIKVPEIQKSMMELSKEMTKAGIIEEMMEDTFDVEDEDLEEAADEEVAKVLYDLTDGLLGEAKHVDSALPGEEEEEEEEVENVDAMKDRLAALKV